MVAGFGKGNGGEVGFGVCDNPLDLEERTASSCLHADKNLLDRTFHLSPALGGLVVGPIGRVDGPSVGAGHYRAAASVRDPSIRGHRCSSGSRPQIEV